MYRDPHTDEAYYTKSSTVSLVQNCLNQWMQDNDILRDSWIFVGPTAGEGVLTRGFIEDALLFDRNPCPQFGVKKSEYDQLDVGSLGENIIILENPPFGQHHAVKFFNYMTGFSQVKYMALIFPDRYRGDQTSANGMSVLNEYFHCVAYTPIPFGSFEEAGGSKVQIQCSFQIWKRMSTKRMKHDVGVDVGQYQVNGENIYWVKRFNPNKYHGKCKCVTRSKPRGRFKNSIPVRIRKRVYSPEDLILDVVKKIWDEYPQHSRQSLHAGNIKNMFNRELGVFKRRRR